eukprot:CAMPEP_0197408802 /NCGR_PEP_ID=MMETSP1165-20131217/28975_1 /TAXON_ID=284809 /ORGANISM="Chrysocystis fragilis, Strain CCMP3189" /LENGTH=48 /DNA_ID= /DNA_START= /DNA_END= /DNA_ORIENTATION=
MANSAQASCRRHTSVCSAVGCYLVLNPHRLTHRQLIYANNNGPHPPNG